jgi:hypothetical protein
MRTFRTHACAAFFVACCGSAFASDPNEPVPGHPGVTYEKLLKQAMLDLSHEPDGSWSVSNIRGLRDIDGKPVAGLDLTFHGIDLMPMREGGRTRLLLITEDNSGTSGFDQIVAVYDDNRKSPNLLDVMDVGRDRTNNFGLLQQLSPDTDLLLAEASHDNSDESYSLISPLFLRGGKLHSAMTLFSYGVATCSYRTTQSPEISTQPDTGSPYRAISVRVTVETTPGEPDCGEDQKPPKYSKKIVSDRYRWNEAKGAFVPVTGAVERLSDANWKKINN